LGGTHPQKEKKANSVASAMLTSTKVGERFGCPRPMRPRFQLLRLPAASNGRLRAAGGLSSAFPAVEYPEALGGGRRRLSVHTMDGRENDGGIYTGRDYGRWLASVQLAWYWKHPGQGRIACDFSVTVRRKYETIDLGVCDLRRCRVDHEGRKHGRPAHPSAAISERGQRPNLNCEAKRWSEELATRRAKGDRRLRRNRNPHMRMNGQSG